VAIMSVLREDRSLNALFSGLSGIIWFLNFLFGHYPC
jgi:hypothetical protein